jgi:hypothetical protein
MPSSFLRSAGVILEVRLDRFVLLAAEVSAAQASGDEDRPMH